MSIPSSVTSRIPGNEFLGVTGMSVTGVTGFGIRTGFYLTNSGNYPITTEISYNESFSPKSFNFPSGQSFEIVAGQNKFIPFEFVFAQDNFGSGPDVTSTGPDNNGLYTQTFRLDTVSQFNGQSDPSGRILFQFTGQVSGFSAAIGAQGAAVTAPKPQYPSGFRAVTDFSKDGRPQATLRWYHPNTGYYLTQYSIEYAGNIDTVAGAGSPTGVWSGLHTFEINDELQYFDGSAFASNPFTMKKYATNTGINQLYSKGTANNRDSNYGEYVAALPGFDSDYYYRIKGQYKDKNDAINYESEYVYAYPVDNFDVKITNNDINNGLLSGTTTLPSSSSSNIKNSAGSPEALYIYFEDGQSDINLKTVFDNEMISRGLVDANGDPDLTRFRAGASNYSFTGVHFVVPETFTVGSKTLGTAAITTGGRIEDDAGTEVTVVLDLEKSSMVAGHGGHGGDGGFTDIARTEAAQRLLYKGEVVVGDKNVTPSTDGRNGTAAIYIDQTNISKLTIRKDASAKIYGGGGGGGGGDPFFWPKSFQIRENSIATLDIEGMIQSPQAKLNINSADLDSDITLQTKAYQRKGRSFTTTITFSQSYKLSDILGTQLAGVGGGGQGFGISLGGASLKEGSDAIFTDTQGSIQAAALGSTDNINNKTSPGGNGGEFGADGQGALNVNAGEFFYNTTDAEPASGGEAGEAIKIIDGNSNYSGIGNLLIFKNFKTLNTTNYPLLLAHFDAGTNVYSDTGGSVAASNGDSVRIWKSVNDPTNIYFQNTSIPNFINGWSSPILYTSTTNYTKYFNNQPVLFFDQNAAAAPYANGGALMCLEGMVRSGKLDKNMESFEIIYLLAPFSDYTNNAVPKHSPFHRPGHNNGSFRKGQSGERNGRKSVWGWPLHQWSDIGRGDYSEYLPQESWQNPNLFYDTQGTTVEGAGLPNPHRLRFTDFTNGINPGRAWMYSVSARKRGNHILYGVYNNLNLVSNSSFEADQFSWIPKPLIGGTKTHHPTNGNTNWYGSISDILIFKASLTKKERAAIFNYLCSKKLQINSSSDKTDETKRNTLDMQNGFAGFNIGPSW